MKSKALIFALAICVFLATGANAGQSGSQRIDTAVHALVRQLVAALNSKDEAQIQKFVQDHLVSNAPVEQRVRRWAGVAENGAPFQLVRDLDTTADQSTVILLDKAANRIALIVHFESAPKLRILGIQLAPAYTREGTSPELQSWKTLDALAEGIASKSKSPGAAIAFMRNGELHVGKAGLRMLNTSQSIEPNDAWEIGSIGKPICSTVIGKLVQSGKLSWNETLKQALPNLPMLRVYATVTIDQLLHHRAGIRPDISVSLIDLKAITRNAKTATEARARYAADVLSKKPTAAPKSQFLYSNAGYTLLTAIVDRVYGKPYEMAVEDLVFHPLGLLHSHTSAKASNALGPRGYTDSGDLVEAAAGQTLQGWVFAGSGVGMTMSIGDLAKFGWEHVMALSGNGRILSQNICRRLHEGLPQGPHSQRIYAAGWGIEPLPGLESFHGHNGSTGAMRAQLAIFPESGLVVAAAVNRGGVAEPSPPMEAVLAIAERYAIHSAIRQ